MADALIKEQISEFFETFTLFDLDKDERLSLSELGTMLSALGQNLTEAELLDMVSGLENVDPEHRIDFPSFLSLMARKMKESDTEEELIEAFKVFDRNCDGLISAAELRQSMQHLGETLDDSEVDEMIKEADADGDSMINYDEFVKMMMAK
ncbi:unnamed protein product [Polarella glacialis]|uniref:EF-hand domain-containing protein n=1 Tax=Polarella glacialis TaxID=89957 RepID=A0A813LUQ8_POLGL|nr:unnamed protein product [Polarella glacialis]